MKGTEMFTPAQIQLAKLREDALTDQMALMKELEQLSSNPDLTRKLADRLIDRTIHYCNFDQEIRNLYDQAPEPEKKAFFKRLRELMRK